MNSFEFLVFYGNKKTEEWDVVDFLMIEPYQEPDFSKGVEFIKKSVSDSWKKVFLPNGETIELMTIFVPDRGSITLHVRQNMNPLIQVICGKLSSVCFRTLASNDVNLQVHPIGSHKTIKEARKA